MNQITAAADNTQTIESAANDEPPRPNDYPPILTVDELATLLRVNRKTVYKAIEQKQIPGIRRIGSALRVHRDTVLTWIADGQGSVSRSPRGAR